MLLQSHLTSAEEKAKLIEAIDAGLDELGAHASRLDGFRRKIRQSPAVAARDVPADMITMGARFVLRDLHSNESICYSLVFPNQEAIHEGRLSVLTPMGMAILGAREGDSVTWRSAAGRETACVERVLYQRERAAQRSD